MSENIIYCYSGSGHCLNMAKSIASRLGDTDIVMMRAFPVKTDATEAKRVGFVFPCYGGGLPGHVEEYIKAIKIAPHAYKFAVEQYAGYIGCGLHKIDEIVGLDYWNTISNHSTCIWLMPHALTVPPTSKQKAQERIDRKAMEVAAAVKAEKRLDVKPPENAFFARESASEGGHQHGQDHRKPRAFPQSLRQGIRPDPGHHPYRLKEAQTYTERHKTRAGKKNGEARITNGPASRLFALFPVCG